MSSQRQRRSTSPRGSKPAAPPGQSVLDHIYANPEEVEEAANQDEIASALKILLDNFKKKTPSPSPINSSSWNSSATPSSSPVSRYVSGMSDESKARSGLVRDMRARFQQPAEPPIPAKRPSKKKARPSSPKTRKKTSPASSAGPTRKVASKKIRSKFDGKKKDKGAPPKSSPQSEPKSSPQSKPKSRRPPKASPRPKKTLKKSASSSPKPEIPPRAPIRKPRLPRKQAPESQYYQNVKDALKPRKPRKEDLYENLGSVADKIRAKESIYENVGKIMRDKFDEAQIDVSKPMPSFKKKAARAAGPDNLYDEPFQQPQTLTSAVAANTTRVVQSNNHVVYRISGDGLCSLNSLFTIMGFSRLRIITPPGARSSSTYTVSHSITPVYLINFFRELSLITKPSCIPKIELIAQFLGFQCNYYQLKYQEKFMNNLSKIIIRRDINDRFRSYLQNLQLFIGVSLMHTTSHEREKFIKDNRLKPINDAMDGDSFLGEIIEEYYKIKSGLDISSLTVTATDIPQTNRFRYTAISEPFIEINDTAQIELPVNPFVLTKTPGDLSMAEQNTIKQNTVYFLHSGRRSASGTASSTSGHWDIVVPPVLHDFIQTRKQGYTEEHERWIQAFVDSQDKIMQDITRTKKGNHWMWYVFPSERPGRSDVKKIKMDLADYDKLFAPSSNYIGFLSTWCNILKQIAEKMESDNTLMKDTWLNDRIDRRRVEHCYSKFEEWFLTKFKPRNTKNIFAIKARFYLAYIYKCVTQGRNAGAIPRPR